MTTTAVRESSEGLICPSCSGVVPIVEGTRIVQCPYCHTHSLLQGDRGIQRWQIARKVDREEVEAALREFLTGARKARDLQRTAKTNEIILAYVPFWRVEATVAGWLFGRLPAGESDTKPSEYSIFERMQWIDAALDVSDLNVHRVPFSRDDLQPYDSRQLHAEAMVFDPTETAAEALEEAQSYFRKLTFHKSKQVSTSYSNIQYLSPAVSIIYYPVWMVRYGYRQRTYQVVVDGVTGNVMYGKAPGNTWYRAVTLVSSLAAGTFVMVNGTILLLAAGIGEDDGFGFVIAPIVAGLMFILWGYRNFRFGEEVADQREEHRKASAGRGKGLFSMAISEEDWTKLRDGGLAALDDMTKAQPKRGNDR